MSDFYHSGGGVGLSSFRANTEKHAVMAGVATIPGKAQCYACGKMTTRASGKITKAGRFLCCSCHSPRTVS